MKKRFVAFLLVLIMVLGMLPVSAMAASNSTVVLHPSVNSTVTGVKVKVGDTISGHTVSTISGYDITVDLGEYNVNNDSFTLPYAKNIWEGVDNNQVDYISWAGGGSNKRSEGGSALLVNGKNTAYYYFKGATPTRYTYHLIHEFNYVGGTRWDIMATTAAESYQIDVNKGKPTRDRYKFDGWADTANATTASYFGGELITLTKDNPIKTIYAVWKPIFELRYDANGGTGAPDSQTYTALSATSTQATFTVPNQTPTKEGYTFKGWADSATATDAQYQPGGPIAVKHENSPKTVYAVWEESAPQPPLIPVPSYDDLKSAIGKIQVKDVSTPSCGTENYDLIDNTQSEPFNWTKTARLDQPGKYDVTIKTAPYVAKYNSEKSKTHELNNANQTTLKLVISYENNTWKLDDGLRVIEVKHSEQTPPTDKPAKPTENDVTGVVVDIVCVTKTGTHDTVQSPLGFATTPQHTIGEVASDGAGGYICPVTVRTAWFVQQASNLVWKVQHTPTAQTITFNLTYDKNSKTWVKPAANPRIEATHEVTPPTKPTALDGSFAIVCKNNKATHPYKADYIATPSQYTISDVQMDDQGYYVTATVTVAPNLVAYNKATRAEHRLVNEQDATLTITFRYDTEATVDGNRKWKQQGDLPVVEVICKEIEAPTREDIFKALNGLVTVTCINRFWKDGNNNMDCGQGQYAAKAGIAGQDYTLEKGENAGTWVVTFPVTNFVKSFKQNPAHNLYTKNTLSWNIRWEDNAWTSAPVEPGVDDLVKLTHAPTDWREVAKIATGGKSDCIHVSCVNGETGVCDYGITVPFVYSATDVVSVEPEDGVPGSYIATFKVDRYIDTCAKACNDKNFKDAPRTHKLLTQETVQWRLYATPEADEKIGSNVPNHVWEAEPVKAGKDDVCTIAHNWVVTFNPDNGGPAFTQNVEYEGKAIKPTPDPEKTGYTFDGWYLGDEKYDFSAAVEQNITLTAKWMQNTYTVTFDPNGGNELAEADKTKAVKIGEAYGELPTPTRKGYNFAGWYTEAEEGTVVTADTTVSAMTDHTLYAHWEAKKANVHIMIFKSNDLGTPIVDRAYTTDAVYGDTLDLAEIDPSSYLDFDFEIDGGWYDDGLFNLYKKYVSGEQANKPAALTKLQITGNWQNLKLIVTELVPVVYFKSAEALAEYQNDHSKVENIIFTTKARVGSTLPTADAPTATRDGYTFTFWSREGQIGTDVTGQTVNGWTNLVANWEARTDTPYTVEHYLENLDGSYALDTTEPLKGTTDTTVTAAAKSYDNFTYDSTVPGTVASGNIAGDGSLVLKLFYTRNTYDYTVRHIKQLPDGSYDEANAEVETLSGKFEALAAVTAKDYGEHYPTNDADTKQNIKIKKGLTIDVKYDLDEHTLTFETNGGSAINPVTVRHGNAVARPADPTKDKYTFIGWYADPEFTEEYDFATVLEADKTIYAKFELTSTPIGDIYVRYDVLHIKQLPDGTYDLANAEVEHLSAKKDTTVTAVIKDYRATHHVNVNRTLSKLTGTAIQPYMGVDGKPVYTILSVYYDLDFHTLTFDTMGGSKIAPETVRHGLTVAKPKDPVNGGYIFDGWYTDKTFRTPYNFATPLTQDTTIYAKWFLIVLPGVTVKKNTPKLNTSDHFAYVQGYPDGTVKPAGNITRAETAAILFRLMDDASRKTYYSTKSGFRDVASGSWYNTYVATLNNAGVITDSSNGYFRPNEAITRAELAAMLAKFSETTGAANYFNDVSAKYWAANAIAICAKLGWITGYPDGTFRPDKNVTRAELMAMINRATGRAPKSADAFLPGMKTWIDNTSDKWYYLDVQEATNSHSYTVKGSETWTALTSDPNWSLYE